MNSVCQGEKLPKLFSFYINDLEELFAINNVHGLTISKTAYSFYTDDSIFQSGQNVCNMLLMSPFQIHTTKTECQCK